MNEDNLFCMISFITYLLAASSFFKSSSSSIETSFGKELLLVQADVLPESEVSPLGVDVDLARFTGFSTEVPFEILFSCRDISWLISTLLVIDRSSLFWTIQLPCTGCQSFRGLRTFTQALFFEYPLASGCTFLFS